MAEVESRLERIESELIALRAQVPPKWMAWLMGTTFTLTIGVLITWSTWITTLVIRLESQHKEFVNMMGEHRALPIHPGAAESLSAVRDQLASIRTDIKVLETKLSTLLKESHK